MEIIPAIDIKNGRCVRLFQGKAELETVFSYDPVAVAKRWESLGARRLHVVDLDGAFAGSPVNTDIISTIVSGVAIPIELGGGIRNIKDIEDSIARGIRWVILGTKAALSESFIKEALKRFSNRIILGIDSLDGKVAIDGWKTVLDMDAKDFGLKMVDMGVETVIYTDIARDGTMKGPNIHSIEKFAKALKIKLIVSGGIRNKDDLAKIAPLSIHGVTGVIIGKAIYTGEVDLKETIILFGNR